ncbi:MAG TPA: 4Fe-4S dicluster domain-containing protein [Gemmatimonadaceae bacterium]|jgi:molybdopterin-containing oxidoreductase family iron-sulfur binding subunit
MTPGADNREFPEGAAIRPDGMPRRDFVKLLGASIALAGLDGCIREPDQKILPYIDGNNGVIPGVAQHYATSMTIDGFATGLIVESHEGRPTKIEGNPDHPASLGAAGVFEQAAVLQLYDPHRARRVTAGGRATTSQAALAAFAPAALANRVGATGAGLRLLLEPTSSPLTSAWLDRVRERYPSSRVYFHAPLQSAAQLDASRQTFGAPLLPRYDFTQADVVVALDADLLASGPFHLRYARDFSTRRQRPPRAELYVAECSPSPTGNVADNRLAASPTVIARLLASLLSTVAADPRTAARAIAVDHSASTLALSEAEKAWVSSAAGALLRAGARGVVVAGERLPVECHVAAHALNAMLGAAGQTVVYNASPIVGAGEPSHDIMALQADLASGDVDTLVILQGNPCYAAPGNVPLATQIKAIRNTLYLGMYDNETARASTWHIPAAHFLEAWGDSCACDGTESMVQPLIAPLYDGRTNDEILSVLAGAPDTAHALLRQNWQRRYSHVGDIGAAWTDAIQRGLVMGTQPPVTTNVRADAVVPAHRALIASAQAAPSAGTIDAVFAPSRAVYDGRFADNAWLQELPDPITKLTWDNAALLSPRSAQQLGVTSGDVVEVSVGNQSLRIPALVVPGHADGVTSLAIGYGRTGAEAIARGVGVNVNALRTSVAPHAAIGGRIRGTGDHVELAVTQGHWTLEGREDSVLGITPPPAPSDTTPASSQPRKRRPLTLYEPPAPSSAGFGADQWAMVIDLDQCTGCSACVVACQAENNVPVVGKDGVLASREMHWLRIDRYLSGPPETPSFDTQPMLCQHCEKAPCEYVCPVDATVHSDDGLNEMVYNRCVGTRFCSNNCPYKVRRFNWFDYNDELTPVEQMVKNPQVTVRERGVMEKCTFCVQRVRHAQRDADLAGAPHTGPVQTACQQTCPSQAIVFGSLTAPDSEVAKLSNDPRAFSALAEEGTVPRVRYLSRKRNAGA